MIKVHQLARELGKTAKDIIAALHEMGADARKPTSDVGDVMADDVREAFGAARLAPRPEVAPEPPAEPEATESVATPAAPTEPAAPGVGEPPEARPVSKISDVPAPVSTESASAPVKTAETEAPRAAPVLVDLDTVEEKSKEVYRTIPLDRIKPRQRPTAKAKEREAPPPTKVEPEALAKKEITLKGFIAVRDLAAKLGLKPNQVISDLMRMNILASITQMVDVALAAKVAEGRGFTVIHEKKATEQHAEQLRKSQETRFKEEVEKPEDLQPRSPVVVFMGHVDHGKTSLLDRIRNSSVASGEHGGITQHIGAYRVDARGKSITFLDTPGHAAFTSMRARGANLTDIAVIVIAADDGIMPQTLEAISHAKAAKVSIMAAVNKMDLPQANPARILQQLGAQNLLPEEFGGQTICCQVSAITGDGIDHLLDMILLQAEILDLRANTKCRAQGFVIEAKLEQGRGTTVTLLVTKGTLRVGDALVCGPFWGRVKALLDDKGERIDEAGPSTPVICLGLSGVPDAGASFGVMANDRAAKAAAQEEETLLKEMQIGSVRKASLDSIFAQIEAGERRELNVVIKADSQGSIEAIVHAFGEIKSAKVSLNIVLGAPGNITVNDIMLASASDAVVLGFHVAKESGVDALCRREGVEVRLHTVIYEMLDQVREAMTGMLAPLYEENPLGKARVKQVFALGKIGTVAGSLVIQGVVRANGRIRVHRGDETLYEGSIASLKHFQNSVSEVREAQECGIRLDRFNDIREDDILECYEVREVKQAL